MPVGAESGVLDINSNSSYVGVATVSITVPTVTEADTSLIFEAQTKYGGFKEDEVIVGVITA